MAVTVNPSQSKSLDCGSERPRQQWSDEERGPETEPSADLESKKCAEHVEACMREIENAEHAEDDGQAACHQKQQHSEQNAVQRGYDNKFKHDTPPPRDEPASLRRAPERRKFAR